MRARCSTARAASSRRALTQSAQLMQIVAGYLQSFITGLGVENARLFVVAVDAEAVLVDLAEMIAAERASGVADFLEKSACLSMVLRHAPTALVKHAEVVACGHKPGVTGLGEEGACLGIVLAYAFAVQVKNAEIVACVHHAALTCLLLQSEGLLKVLWSSLPTLVEQTKAGAAAQGSSIAGLFEKRVRLQEVLGHTSAALVKHAEIVAAIGVSAVAGFLGQGDGLTEVLRHSLTGSIEQTEHGATVHIAAIAGICEQRLSLRVLLLIEERFALLRLDRGVLLLLFAGGSVARLLLGFEAGIADGLKLQAHDGLPGGLEGDLLLDFVETVRSSGVNEMLAKRNGDLLRSSSIDVAFGLAVELNAAGKIADNENRGDGLGLRFEDWAGVFLSAGGCGKNCEQQEGTEEASGHHSH